MSENKYYLLAESSLLRADDAVRRSKISMSSYVDFRSRSEAALLKRMWMTDLDMASRIIRWVQSDQLLKSKLADYIKLYMRDDDDKIGDDDTSE